jgi:hypothetical protein
MYQDQNTKLQETIDKYGTDSKTALVAIKKELRKKLFMYNPQARICTLFGCRLFGGKRTRRRHKTRRYKRLNRF